MTRERTQYRCRDCGSVSPRWAGRCGHCGEWNTLEEEGRPAPFSRASAASRRPPSEPVALGSLAAGGLQPIPTGVAELDRVLGGGLVPSSVTLIAGEPGIGKSTLLLQMAGGLARRGRRTLLVSAEESPAQVGLRAARLGIDDDGIWIVGDTDLAAIRAAVAGLRPDVLVVDSIQTISDPEGGGLPGTVGSVRACASALTDDAKAGGPAVVLVGHVTKDGSIAGPRVLEHLVDTVLSFEGERHHALRLLRAVKHRFGPVGELGMWEMTGAGLEEVPDGAAFLLADRRPGAPGSVVFAGMEGRRPLLVEIQALVAPAGGGGPRRSASGYESGRLGQLVAVLDRRAGVDLRSHDVYVSAVGGVRLGDPGADLAVAAAISSAATGRVVPADMVVIGEVGLGGELRQVAHTPRRLAEAARLGFRRALVPVGVGAVPELQAVFSDTLGEALDLLLSAQPAPRPRLRVLSGAGGTLTAGGDGHGRAPVADHPAGADRFGPVSTEHVT
ncbi:MAG TPA: DNA repair protein RadA [Acidimicrobiales bacterium]|nr:DNA repair protein RadA [Acidimicrobiales bacterium]